MQYAYIYPPQGLSQGQMLKLRPQPPDPHVYFDCAGININTLMAEGCLHDTTPSRVAATTPRPVVLRLIAGGTRLGVTGNYSISTTELSERYEGRAIAVDIAKRVGGPSEYRLLHIHHMHMDFHTHYLVPANARLEQTSPTRIPNTEHNMQRWTLHHYAFGPSFPIPRFW